MSTSEPEPKLHPIRRIVVSDASQRQIDWAITLHQASHGDPDDDSPESRGLTLATIACEWRKCRVDAIREVDMAGG